MGEQLRPGLAAAGAEAGDIGHHSVHGIAGLPPDGVPAPPLPRAEIAFAPARLGLNGAAPPPRDRLSEGARADHVRMDHAGDRLGGKTVGEQASHGGALTAPAHVASAIASSGPGAGDRRMPDEPHARRLRRSREEDEELADIGREAQAVAGAAAEPPAQDGPEPEEEDQPGQRGCRDDNRRSKGKWQTGDERARKRDEDRARRRRADILGDAGALPARAAPRS